MRKRCCVIAPLLWALTVVASVAQVLPVVAPDAAGMTAARVERLKAGVREYADRQQIAGAVVVLLRGGRVVLMEPVGRMDIEGNRAMRRDTIFRLASMSKAVTSVAAMMLMEEGKLRLSDPVSRFLPAFKQTSVAVTAAGTGRRFGVVPARREVNIRDLLTHTAGISYGTGPAADDYKAAGLQGWYLSDKKEPIVPLMERLASLPFDNQPGEQYIYGYNTDILGAVIEKASGMPLDEFFRARIFEPLKMTDTSFYLPPEKRDRLAVVYSAGPEGRVVRAPGPGTGQGDYVEGPRVCFSGGAGLLSTASDYARFLQMLLNGGELEGARVLGPKYVELMTTNHVGSLYSEGRLGFGLGFELTEHVGRAARPDSVGTFGWGSAYYSTYWVDPQEKLVAILLTQLIPAANLDLREKFRYLVYQTVVGPLPPSK